MQLRRVLAVSLSVLSCSSAAPAPKVASSTAVEATSKPQWFENDYAGALAAARARKVPLFVDASAVWCHTCLAMRAYVLENEELDDDRLDRSAFVWVSFDVERPENAAVAARYPAKVLPTFFVVDPANEVVHGRWEGAASVAQLREFLRDAKRSIEVSHRGSLASDDPLAYLLAGHHAAMKGDDAIAARYFDGALERAPATWPRRSDALLALIASLERSEKFEACLELGLTTLEGDALGRSSTLADFAGNVLDCAERSPPSDAVTSARRLVSAKLQEVALDPLAPMSPDDRGDALRMVWAAEEALGSPARAREVAGERLVVLDAGARSAPNPAVASTYDGARMETLVYLGRAQEAVAFLTQRERELPNDYNPPHRLAAAYEALGDHANALAAIDRAIAKAWGARKARLFEKRADILIALGRNEEAKATLEQALSHLRSLPSGQRKPALEATIAKRLETLASPPPGKP